MDKNIKIGWVGTGVMGAPMCGHLLNAGFDVSVYSRTASKAESMVSGGAKWCSTPSAISETSDVIFTMVGTPEEVESVYFGDDGLLATSTEGKTFIDMSTTAPSLSLRIFETATLQQATTIDAPVSGGDIGALNGTLSIMAGGDESAVNNVKFLFDVLGSVRYMGVAGSGQHTKMCNQLTVAGTMIGVCEALVYAEKAGLDCARLIEAIRPGAAGCWTLDNLAPRIINNDFEPGFMVDHFVKDLGIALQQAKIMGLNLAGLELANKLYRDTQAMGLGKSGTQALVKAIKKYSE